jgi:hypothetical protein
MDDWQRAVMANLASLNEIVTELVQASADGTRAEPEFAELVRDTLRQHTHALGFRFQGEIPPGAERKPMAGWERRDRQVRQVRREYIAPVETGEPWRSAAEREWDDSRGDDR